MLYRCNYKWYVIKTVRTNIQRYLQWYDYTLERLFFSSHPSRREDNLKKKNIKWVNQSAGPTHSWGLSAGVEGSSVPPSLTVITACAPSQFTALSVCLATPHQHSLPSLMRRLWRTPTPPGNLPPTLKSILAKTHIHAPTNWLQNAKDF